MSETTTANQEPTTTSGDYESRATTAVTGEDDGVSTTTGFTAGAESGDSLRMSDVKMSFLILSRTIHM